MKLSAIVITKNEAENIERCLSSLAFADERIVVDSKSTDATRDLAQRAGATVYLHPWSGFGGQKNFGASQAQGEWVLFIDADEEVSPALARAIRQAINNPGANFYWLRIVTVFLGRPLRHLYGHNPRLFKKAAGRWTESSVHEQVVMHSGPQIMLGDTHSVVLTEPLLHHSHASIALYLSTMHEYTTREAHDMVRTGHHRSGRVVRSSLVLPLTLALRQFIKMYFYKRGFLDGWAGLVWCVLSSYYEWEAARKFRALCA